MYVYTASSDLGSLGFSFKKLVKKTRKITKKAIKRTGEITRIPKAARSASKKIVGKKITKKIGKVAGKTQKLLTNANTVKKTLGSGNFWRDVGLYNISIGTGGIIGGVALGLKKRQLRRQKKKYHSRTKENIRRMQREGKSQKEIDQYIRSRKNKRTHRRKKYQRGVRAGAAAAAVVATTIATGGAPLTMLGSGAAAVGKGALTVGKGAADIMSKAGPLVINGAQMTGSLLRGNPGEYDIDPMTQQQMDQASYKAESAYIAQQQQIEAYQKHQKNKIVTTIAIGGAGLAALLLI